MLKERNKQFDILLFIGIIFVVVGHVGGIDILNSWFPIYSFHMPLFFFISGYFYKKESENTFSEVVTKKFKKFVIPYFAWNFIYMVINFIVVKLNIIESSIDMSYYSLFVVPFQSGTQLPFFYSAAWFVLTMFLTQITYILIRKIMCILKLNNEWIIMILLLVLGMIAIYASRLTRVNFYTTHNYMIFTKIFFCLPYYHLGFLYKNNLSKIIENIKSSLYFIILAITQIIILTVAKGDVTISVWDSYFINDKYILIAPYIIALPGIFFYLRIARLLIPVIGDNKYVSKVARNTYSIMTHHQFVAFMINCILFIAYKIHPFDSFSVETFRKNGWYVSQAVSNFSIIYLVLGIIVPIYIKEKSDVLLSYIKLIWSKLKYKDSRLWIFLVFFFGNLIGSLRMKSMAHWPDEPLTIAIPAYFAGYDWSDIVSKVGNYYGYGYSILLYPIFRFIKNSTCIYTAISCFNTVLISFIPIIAFTIVKNYLNVKEKKWQILISVLSGVFPLYCSMSKIAMNETACMLYPWFVLWLLLITINAENKIVKYLLSYCLGFAALYGYLIHGRLIVIIVTLLFITILLLILTRKQKITIIPFGFGVATVAVIDHYLRKFILSRLYHVLSEDQLNNTFMETFHRTLTVLKTKEGLIIVIREIFCYISTEAAVTFGLVFIGLVGFYNVLKEYKKNNSNSTLNKLIMGIYVYVLLIGAIGVQTCFHINRTPIFIYERYSTYLSGIIVFYAAWSIYKGDITKRIFIITSTLTSILFVGTWIVEYVLNIPKAYILPIEIPTLSAFIFRPHYDMGWITTKEFFWAVLFVVLVMFIIIMTFKKKTNIFYLIIVIYLVTGIRSMEKIWIRCGGGESYPQMVDFFDDMRLLDKNKENIFIEPNDIYPYSIDSLVLLPLKDYNLLGELNEDQFNNYEGYMITNEPVEGSGWKFIGVETEAYRIYVRGERLETLLAENGYNLIESKKALASIYPITPHSVNIAGIYSDRYWCTGDAQFELKDEIENDKYTNLILETNGSNQYIQRNDIANLNLKVIINDKYELYYNSFEDNKFTFSIENIHENIKSVQIESNTFTTETDSREFGIDLKALYFE